MPRPDAPPSPLLPNLHLLDEAAYATAEEFLRRRAALAPERRAMLAAELSAILRQRLALPEGGDPERFVEHLAREYRLYQELSSRQSG